MEGRKREGGEVEDVMEEKYTMEEEVERNRNKSKFLLNVCCVSATHNQTSSESKGLHCEKKLLRRERKINKQTVSKTG